MPANVLCLSRSYLSHLLPRLGTLDSDAHYFHIVQTDAEERSIKAMGGNVVLNLQAVVREKLNAADAPQWREPDDFRTVTNYPWSPLYADRNIPNFGAEHQSRIAGIVLEAVERLFAERHYDAFVSEPVAIFVTHILLYFCKKNGTRPLLWMNTYFPGYFYFADEVETSTPRRRAGESAYDAVREAVSSYVNGVVGDRAGPVYHHAFAATQGSADYLRQRKGEKPLVLRRGLASMVIQALRLVRARVMAATFPRFGDYMTAGAVAEHQTYMGNLLTPSYVYDEPPNNSSDRNVVYPLQYEPEASLIYFAPEIVSQLSFVETVLRALPGDSLLYVKEHPNQFGALGASHWRALRARYKNLRFIHGRQSGRALIKKCGPVVTISSSMGLDGLLLGRRVIVAGRVYYRNFTGTVPVSSHAEMAEALNNPATYRHSDNLAANIEELVAFGAFAYPGDPQPADTLYDERNMSLLVSALRAEYTVV